MSHQTLTAPSQNERSNPHDLHYLKPGHDLEVSCVVSEQTRDEIGLLCLVPGTMIMGGGLREFGDYQDVSGSGLRMRACLPE